MEKKCSLCGETLNVGCFNKESLQKSGLRPRCRKCDKIGRTVKAVIKEKECTICKRLLKSNNYYSSKLGPGGLMSHCMKCETNRRLKKTYGITLKEYDEMFDSQEGNCAICGLPEITRRLSVDHDHTTGEVRSLLCTQCNLVLGTVSDNQDVLTSMIKYLQKHSADIRSI